MAYAPSPVVYTANNIIISHGYLDEKTLVNFMENEVLSEGTPSLSPAIIIKLG